MEEPLKALTLRDAEYSDDEDDSLDLLWLLGFCEPPESPESLLRHQFPSKVGGRPAWLDPVRLPSRQQLSCGVTGKPLDFLLQVYAPVEDNDAAFHRAVYVFITPRCTNVHRRGAVRAFRCQMPRANDFYAAQPPGHKDRVPPQLKGVDLAEVAAKDPWGVLAQEESLRQGKGKGKSKPKPSSQLHRGDPEVVLRVFPESELVVEEEGEDKAEDIQRMVREFEASQSKDPKGSSEPPSAPSRSAGGAEGSATAPSGGSDPTSSAGAGPGPCDDVTEEEMKEMEGLSSKERQQFAHFQAVIDKDPEQVLRYCFDDGARPLWPSTMNVPKDSDIPCCDSCGAKRKFEFQVLPTIINFLETDPTDPESADWGMISVYTCSASCSTSSEPGGHGGYREEFVWCQPP